MKKYEEKMEVFDFFSLKMKKKGVKYDFLIKKCSKNFEFDTKKSEKWLDIYLDKRNVRESGGVIYEGSPNFPKFEPEFDLRKR